MGKDDGCGIESQGLLDHLPGMNGCTVDRTAKHLLECQNPMIAVEKETGKHLVLVTGQFLADSLLGGFG